MDEHADTKGIIHTTSYAQLEFIWEILKQKNKRKLIPNVSLLPDISVIVSEPKSL